MKPETLVLEGTWEEMQKHADKLARKHVRVTVLPPRTRRSVRKKMRVGPKDKTTTKFLTEFAGAWVGGDIADCLKWIYATRGKARF